MSRALATALLLAGALPLGGCVAGMAFGAANVAAKGVQGKPKSNEHLRQTAVSACTERAAPHGAVHIIDVEQRAVNRTVVWGTADNGARKISFECRFREKIVGFKLREIPKPAS